MADPINAAESAAVYATGGISLLGIMALFIRKFLRQVSSDKTATALDSAAATNYQHLQGEITRLNSLVRELSEKLENQQKEIDKLRGHVNSSEFKIMKAVGLATVAVQATDLLCTCPEGTKEKITTPLKTIIELIEKVAEAESQSDK